MLVHLAGGRDDLGRVYLIKKYEKNTKYSKFFSIISFSWQQQKQFHGDISSTPFLVRPQEHDCPWFKRLLFLKFLLLTHDDDDNEDDDDDDE
jgi:hypothetical protein